MADDIIELIAEAIRNRAPFERDKLKLKAIKQFAELNGWVQTTRTARFRVINIYNDGYETPAGARLFDHPLFFKEKEKPYYPAAMVGQPYMNAQDTQNLMKVRGRIGNKDATELVWHVPPLPLASIWSPGQCAFIVLTRPGIEVKWLPGQS